MQNIWIVNQYASCPTRGTSCRHFMIARELVKKGYNVTIIAGSGHYFHHERPNIYGCKNQEVIDGVKFVWLRTPHYKQNQKIIRGVAWIVFLISLFFVRSNRPNQPNILLHSSPSLIPFLGSFFIAWRYRAKIFFEFRDVWPLTFVEISNYSPLHPIVLVQGWIEKFAIRKSVACLSSLEYGSKRLTELGLPDQKFYWLPNGVIFEDFSNCRTADDKELVGQENLNLAKKFVFGYVGTHGYANALGPIVEAAKLLEAEPIHIIFVGDGAERLELKARADAMSLNNISFWDAVSKKEIPSILHKMDALLISWHESNIYRYGTSANKLAEYFAAGKPVVQAYSGAGDNVEKFKAGITVPADNVMAFSEAMIRISQSDDSTLEKYGKNAQMAAYNHFRFQSLANRFIKILNEHV